MRLDKFLSDRKIGARSRVKDLVRKGLVSVNGETAYDSAMQIDSKNDVVCFKGKPLRPGGFVYYMLNKPKGVVSATRDSEAQTVVELLRGADLPKGGVFPVGRLDRDTEGLVILTDDGALAHRVLAPKSHVDKTYHVTVRHPLSEEDIRRLEQGVDIGEKKPTLEAVVNMETDTTFFLTIREGKYHQIKRMLEAVDNSVTALKRVSFGGIELDNTLKPGEYRELTGLEVERLNETRDA